MTQTCQGCCAVFSKNPDGSYKYAMGEKDGDLRQFTKEMNMKLNGRGGGKPFFVQGSVQAAEEEIRRFLSSDKCLENVMHIYFSMATITGKLLRHRKTDRRTS